MRLLRPCGEIGHRRPFLPFGDRLLIDTVTLGERPQALLTIVYRSTHRLCRAGAPVKNLSHSASCHSDEKTAPENDGTKHTPRLHRLFQRHGISRLPDTNGAKPKKKFKADPIGYVHIDIAEVRTEEGKLHMFVAIDRTSKAAFVQLHERANTKTAVAFLNDLVEAMPYAIHTVLTDNGIQFADLPKNRDKPTAFSNRRLRS